MNRSKLTHAVFQCLLIFVSLTMILSVHRFLGGITVASLGATSFIIIALPHAESSRSSHVLGGYLCAAAAGLAFNFLYGLLGSAESAIILVCAGSAALTAFMMAITEMAHPPAAALALGLAFDNRPLYTAVAAFIGAAALCAVRGLFSRYLINLIEDKSDNATKQNKLNKE